MYAALYATAVEAEHKLDNSTKMLLTVYWLTVKYWTKTGMMSMFAKEKNTLQIKFVYINISS